MGRQGGRDKRVEHAALLMLVISRSVTQPVAGDEEEIRAKPRMRRRTSGTPTASASRGKAEESDRVTQRAGCKVIHRRCRSVGQTFPQTAVPGRSCFI